MGLNCSSSGSMRSGGDGPKWLIRGVGVTDGP
jgi:hypothetical protein